jgi:protocatechuate 3,4-dioxygenase beta subunit
MFFPNGSQPVRDPVLDCVPESVKSRLFPVRETALDADGLPAYRFDLILRGAGETPFFLD